MNGMSFKKNANGEIHVDNVAHLDKEYFDTLEQAIDWEYCKKCPKQICDNYRTSLSKEVMVTVDNAYFYLFMPCDHKKLAATECEKFIVDNVAHPDKEYFDTLEQAIDFELSEPVDLETALALSKIKSMIEVPDDRGE